MPALAAAALAGLLALAAIAGQPVLAAGVLFVQGMLAVGAVRSLALPSAHRVAALAMVAAATATMLLAFVADGADLSLAAPVLGLAFVPAVAIQLGRRDGRSALTLALSSSLLLVALAVLPAFWVALVDAGRGRAGLPTVLLSLTGVAAAALVEMVPGSRALVRTVGVVAAGAASALLSALVPAVAEEVPAVSALAIATCSSLLAAATWAVLDRVAAEASSRWVPDEALRWWRAAGPLAAVAPVAYVLGRVLVG